ncbi:PREDICTED: CD48 antigen-like [Charadrius vociferus]|uniref:CD48 antigen-like n=1 Tax=Charadrius vociferus TaxID=50402 RepID=UPI0005215EBE|nr:PREDICTED: CD48 antigen-like [Charadrius vociferus]
MGMSPRHPRPCVPWLLVPLLVVAGTASTQPQQVHSILGGYVSLSPVPPNKTVKEIEWSFSDGASTIIQVAEFGPDSFKRPNPKDRFKERLEMFNATALKIRALERGDSGIYGARIKLQSAELKDQFFDLSIYGPVPEPEIHHQQLSLTTQGCNVTLRCSVPAGSDAHAAWHPRVPRGQFCQDGQRLCLAVPTSAFNTSYTCVAQNPIQERNVSIRLDTVCRQQETHGWWRWPLCLVLLAVATGALLGIVWLWRKKRKKASEGAALDSPSSEDAPLEMPYAEIQRRNPPAVDEWVRLGG